MGGQSLFNRSIHLFNQSSHLFMGAYAHYGHFNEHAYAKVFNYSIYIFKTDFQERDYCSYIYF